MNRMEKVIFDKKWYNGEKILGLRFKKDDTVIIVDGEHENKTGRVHELVNWEDDPVYIVELTQEPYGEHSIPQSNIALM